jgi:hypothetical protein
MPKKAPAVIYLEGKGGAHGVAIDACHQADDALDCRLQSRRPAAFFKIFVVSLFKPPISLPPFIPVEGSALHQISIPDIARPAARIVHQEGDRVMCATNTKQ